MPWVQSVSQVGIIVKKQTHFSLKGRNLALQVDCDRTPADITHPASGPAVIFLYNVKKFELSSMLEADDVMFLPIQVCRFSTCCCRTWPRRKQPLRASIRRISVTSYNTSSPWSLTHHILLVSFYTIQWSTVQSHHLMQSENIFKIHPWLICVAVLILAHTSFLNIASS